MKKRIKTDKLGEIAASFRKMCFLAWEVNPWAFSGIVIINLGQGLEPVALAWVTKQIFDHLTSIVARHAFVGFDNVIVVCVIAQLLIMMLYRTLDSLRRYLATELNQKISLRVQFLVYEKINSFQSLKYFEDSQFYNNLELSVQGAKYGPTQILNIIMSVSRAFIVLISFIGIFFSLNLAVTLLVFGVAIIQFYARLRVTRKRVADSVNSIPEERYSNYYGKLIYNVSFAKEVILFNLGDYFLNAFLSSVKKIQEAQKAQNILELKFDMLIYLLSAVVTTLSFSLVLWKVLQYEITIGDVSLYTGALMSVQGALQSIVGSFANMDENFLFFRYLLNLLALPSPLLSKIKQRDVPKLSKGIEFQNVSFRYTDEQPWVLQNCNLFIPNGKVFGIVGLNGVGKSTLIKLLLRYYDPTEGVILWDDIDIREFNMKEYREKISAIFQDYVRYDLTGKENIGLGNVFQVNNMDVIEMVARRTGAHDFIQKLQNGYRTVLSTWLNEEGVSVDLSGGQWQKIANARLLMRNAEVMILDEPTASLDMLAEHEINYRFKEFVNGKTGIIISHRFSTTAICQVIGVLEEGKIVEYGSHIELLEFNGRYKELYDLATKFHDQEK